MTTADSNNPPRKPAPKRSPASRAKLERAADTGNQARLPEHIALVLQGGGALGAYQAGVYQGLHQAGVAPDWLAGISIGAFNTAIIAGNPPERRVAALREFWETISQPYFLPATTLGQEAHFAELGEHARAWLDTWEASRAMIEGQRGFYQPRGWVAGLFGQNPFVAPHADDRHAGAHGRFRPAQRRWHAGVGRRGRCRQRQPGVF